MDLEAQGDNMIERKEVLDHGFVELVDVMGDDYRILQSARVSTGGEASKGDKKDKGLIRYLYKNKHLTPFEQVVTTWHAKAPIFVARQWLRTRTASYNEYSGRYSEMISDFYVPDTFRKQAEKNHQGSEGELDEELNNDLISSYDEIIDDVWTEYEGLLEEGVSREQARMLLPVAQYTEFYMTINLRNLFHFLELRLDDHAQWEIRQYAEAMKQMMENREGLKWSMNSFNEFLQLEQAFRNAINEARKDTSGLLQMLQRYQQDTVKNE